MIETVALIAAGVGACLLISATIVALGTQTTSVKPVDGAPEINEKEIRKRISHDFPVYYAGFGGRGMASNMMRSNSRNL